MVPVAEWTRLMRERIESNRYTTSSIEKTQLEVEWRVFEQYLDLGHTMFALDAATTNQALARVGDCESCNGLLVPCPPVDVAYLANLLQSRNANQS